MLHPRSDLHPSRPRLASRLTVSAVLLLALLLPLTIAPPARASGGIVNGEAFLQTTYTEVGVGANGAFGTVNNPPAGFHPRTEADGYPGLGFVANPKRDGWATQDGDFFMPGSPVEGWGLTVNGASYNNNRHGDGGPMTEIPGSLSNFVSNASGESVEWNGTIAGIAVKQVASAPMGKLSFDVGITLHNTTGAAATVYYIHMVDPDNNESINPNYYDTLNTIESQYGSGLARISAAQPDGSYLALLSSDPRAKVAYGNGLWLYDAQAMWEETSDSANYSGSLDDDIKITLGLKFELAAGETATFSYKFLLAGPLLLDTPGTITSANQGAYPVSGSCITANGNVTVSVGGLSTTAPCTNDSFAASLDVSSLADSPSITITAAQTGAGGTLTATEHAAKTTNVSADLAVTQAYTTTNLSSLTLTITVRNHGPAAATGVTLEDTFPAAAAGASWSWACAASGGATCGAASGSGDLSQSLSVLPAGSALVYTVTGTLGLWSYWSNTAALTLPASISDSSPSDNSSTVGRYQRLLPLVYR